jgi:hypothetical protein
MALADPLEVGNFPFSRTSLEVKQKPSVAKVEVRVVSILMHVFKELRIQDLLPEKNNK